MREKTPIVAKGIGNRTWQTTRLTEDGRAGVGFEAAEVSGPGDVSTRKTNVLLSPQDVGRLLGSLPIRDYDIEVAQAIMTVYRALVP